MQVRLCEVQECAREHVANGLCDMHYRRLKRHGHLKKTRPEDWGQREKHPLYPCWHGMKKTHARFPMDPSWADFWNFIRDVGVRPSSKHWLRRKDITTGFGPNNWEWHETSSNPDRAEYAKQWRRKNPEKAKNNDLRKTFGITLEDYSRMLTEQNGVCATCGGEDNKYYSLAVDHCHTSGKIRGLLCSNCNRAIGLLQDSPDVVRNVLDYLNKHK